MTAQHDPDAVARYAAAVRAAVADLPAGEREQLLDDLEAHLAEVAAESALPLDERLGPPETYATELRTAYGAPARRNAPPRPRRRRWRLALAILVPLLAIGIGAAVWQAGHRGGGATTGQQWSVSRLESEAGAGHVSQVTIQGGTAIATDRSGVTHAVPVPDTTEALASHLVQDDVPVNYTQPSRDQALQPLWILLLALYYLVPVAIIVTIIALVIGVLWRLYRRLGRGTAIM
jgi:uncharacterized membrane protein